MTEIVELNPNYSTTRRVWKVVADTVVAELKAKQKVEDKFETVLFLSEGEGRQGEGGLRTQGYFKACGIIPSPLTPNPSSEAKPLVTVVTVVSNGEKFLEETILSVINQTYNNVEYIIIDGGSTDGTLDIIKKYEHAIDYWVSEKDSGIYDAMNKGIDLATGEWINFMNAGDCLASEDVLAKTFYQNLEKYSLVYGGVEIYSADKKFITTLKSIKINLLTLTIFGTRTVCHQSVFYNASICFRYPKEYKFKGELYSLFEFVKRGESLKLTFPVCKYLLGGVGQLQSQRNDVEMWAVLRQQLGYLRFLHLPMFIYQKLRRLKSKI